MRDPTPTSNGCLAMSRPRRSAQADPRHFLQTEIRWRAPREPRLQEPSQCKRVVSSGRPDRGCSRPRPWGARRGQRRPGYAEDLPQGGFGPSAACAVAPQRSTITAVRNGFTRPQPLAFANDSSAPRHSGARRALPPIGSEPFALQLNACTGWFRRLYREGIPHNASWEIKVYWLEGWAICPISIAAFAAASAQTPSRAAPRPSPGAKHRLPPKHVELACEA